MIENLIKKRHKPINFSINQTLKGILILKLTTIKWNN